MRKLTLESSVLSCARPHSKTGYSYEQHIIQVSLSECCYKDESAVLFTVDNHEQLELARNRNKCQLKLIKLIIYFPLKIWCKQ